MAQATTINLTDALNTEDKTTIEDLALGVCIASVASIADMLALTAVDGMSVNVEGYYGTGTGGGGIFTYDSSLMATNNGGTIILGWVREYSGAIQEEWFGDNKRSTIEEVIASMATGGTVTISCVGDSITWGSDASNSGVQVALPYPARLQEVLRAYYNNSNITVINRGNQGATSVDIIDDLPSISANNPDLILLLIGVNDARSDEPNTVQDYFTNLNTIYDYFSTTPMGIISLTEVSATGTPNRYEVSSYREASKKLAQSYDVRWIDIHTEMDSFLKYRVDARGVLNYDRLHWSLYGYNIIAESVFNNGLSNTKLEMYDGDYKDAAQIGFSGITGTVSFITESTQDVVAYRIENSSSGKIFVYASEPNMQLIIHTKIFGDTTTVTNTVSIQNLSLSNAATTLNTTYISSLAGGGSTCRDVPFNACYLRAGFNEINLSCGVAEEFVILGYSVTKAENGLHVGTSDVYTGKDRIYTSYAGLDDTTFKTISAGSISVTGVDNRSMSEMIIPKPLEQSNKIRLRMHTGQNSRLYFGQGITSVDGVYYSPFYMEFRSGETSLKSLNNLGTSTPILEDALITTPLLGAYRTIEFFSSSTGTDVYINGVLFTSMDVPFPIGRFFIDASTGGRVSIIDTISFLGGDITPGEDVFGEKWVNYIDNTINTVDASGIVVSVSMT